MNIILRVQWGFLRLFTKTVVWLVGLVVLPPLV